MGHENGVIDWLIMRLI